MIERVKYYAIVWRMALNSYARFEKVENKMCEIAWYMLYEMGV